MEGTLLRGHCARGKDHWCVLGVCQCARGGGLNANGARAAAFDAFMYTRLDCGKTHVIKIGVALVWVSENILCLKVLFGWNKYL